jgi:hypothetical protein
VSLHSKAERSLDLTVFGMDQKEGPGIREDKNLQQQKSGGGDAHLPLSDERRAKACERGAICLRGESSSIKNREAQHE